MGLRDDVPAAVWRLSNYSDLSGRGGLIASGRLHTLPRQVLYCSDEAHTAYCEVLRHFGGSSFLIPSSYVLLKIKVPRTIDLTIIEEKLLDSSWRANGTKGWSVCQPRGNDWLDSYRSAMLKVPSAARSNFFNFLVNPVHPHSDAMSILEVVEQPFLDWVTAPA
jgi:RES domain-containing protein